MPIEGAPSRSVTAASAAFPAARFRFALLPALVAALGCGAAGSPPSASAMSDDPARLSAASPAQPAPSADASAKAAPAASAAPSADVTAAQPASGPKPKPKRRAALRFKVGDRPFPAPLVDVVVAGYPTTMIVDTGASHHVLGEWLAREIDLPLTAAGDKGFDHAGRLLKLARVDKPSLSISGWGHVDPPSLLVASLPEPLRHMGIGGVLAPHLLAQDGRVTVLDLRGASMSDEAPEEAARRLDAEGGALGVTGVRACGGPTEGLVLLVQATVDGQPALLKIDTGAERSSLLQTSPAGKILAARAATRKTTGFSAAGKFTVPTLEGIPLKTGELEAAVDLNLDPGRPPTTCSSDGFLGMDILRSCSLLLQGDKTTGRCKR